ncbi:MAG: agmatine deiminase family protein [Planctomyces sp.]|nr:agmatine deiminase family protein [Planctomyces sp.]
MNLECYRWPAEWEAHSRTWVGWPVSEATWPGIFERIPPAYAKFVAAIAKFEPVSVLAGGEGVAESAKPLLDAACEAAGAVFPVELVDIPINDSWARDYGPIFLTGRPGTSASGQAVIVDWNYNAWGGKYPPWDNDALVAERIASRLGISSIKPDLILEGGAIEGNGAGTILTTDNCLLNPNRNAGMTRQKMEDILREYLRCDNVVWVPGHGIIGDDTDGHIDQVARFADTRHVLVAAPWSDDAPEAAELRQNFDAVAAGVNAQGETLLPIPLRMPSPKYQGEHRMPACYCNYYLTNGGVIVPTFGDPADDKAMQLIAQYHPGRKIVGVDAIDLVWGLGAYHCMTQQQPLF